MIDFKVKIAGRIVSVQAMFDSTRQFCEAYLSEGEADFSVALAKEDIAFERQKSRQEETREGIPHRHFSDAYLETIALQRKIAEELFDYDILLFHGSVIAVDGQGYLFTATSGTGKSTHTRLWREVFGDRAVMINDDKPFLRCGEGEVTVFGSPWNGKHGLGTNTCVPLRSICILRRGAENRIREIPPRDVLDMLFQQSNRPRNPAMMLHYMDLIDRLAGNVRFFILECNMNPDAARVAHEAMSAERKDVGYEN